MALLLRHLARPVLAMAAATRLGACDHHEADRGSSALSAPRTTPSAAAAAPEKTLARLRCQVPLSESPAPQASAATDCPDDPTGPPSLPRGWVSFPEAPGNPRVAVEIAATDPSRERGLMYRRKMPEDQGMIFDWVDAAERSFWMRNTCIPLDMLFIDAEGGIAGVLEQVPPLDESPRGVPCVVTHVLELNAGWVRGHGVRPGQHVRIES